ncbi:HAMP domain-containing sensor histidine kinase [Marinobacter sp. CHS3-4]|uniref:sensor histidine kinase n=1 Tax=Marinobacter sp. CHS3-4 TaxID=3045174 RepID=UPI0024B59368|nr:HAMP domain-containing sensor histidine kinase [Marinobacter sp. CHS3-4]MDI9244340.1 HAMP domain-containing sensor histidine kinase [Marinobacter sp. CHS3-4]
MNLLNGLEQIRQLPPRKQRQFERFFNAQSRFRFLPVFADVSLLLTLIGTLAHILMRSAEVGFANVPPLNFVYLAILGSFIAAHRFKAIRYRTPLIMYLVFFNMAIFSYLAFIERGGDVIPIIGLHFFLSFIGIVTLSLFHTGIMIACNLLMLFVSSWIAALGDSRAADVIVEAVLLNWLVLMCLVIAPLSAIFFNRFIRNILALQYLLHDRNQLLTRTFRALKSTEEQLIQQQKHQALSHMAKGLLHEIMNPVNCSIQALSYARDVNSEPDVAEAINDAALHQNRIADIVSDLIEFSLPHPENTKETVPLAELVQTAGRFCRNRLRGIDLLVQIPDTLMVPCYASALTQVFVNLFLNSASALQCRSGQHLRAIEVTALPQGRTLIIDVQDNGCGIAREDLQKLADPFYSTSESGENLGLGLSICQTIMRHHDGSMTIDSEPGHWTRVTLTLPAQS